MAVLRYDIKRNVPATSPPVKRIPNETKLDSSSQSANFLLALCELESPLPVKVDEDRLKGSRSEPSTRISFRRVALKKIKSQRLL